MANYIDKNELAAEVRAWQTTGEASPAMWQMVLDLAEGVCSKYARKVESSEVFLRTFEVLGRVIGRLDADSDGLFGYMTTIAINSARHLHARDVKYNAARSIEQTMEQCGEEPIDYRRVDVSHDDVKTTTPDGAKKVGGRWQITMSGQTRNLKQWCEIYGVAIPTAGLRVARGEHPFVAVSRPAKHGMTATIDGETDTVYAWCQRLGISYATVYRRLRMGWSSADALTRPIKQARTAVIDGVEKRVVDWCADLEIPFSTIKRRIRRGMSPEDAIRLSLDT